MRRLVKKVTGYILLQIRNLFNFFINFKEVSVLCYHEIDDLGEPTSVSPNKFTRQISYLARKQYYFATLDEVVDYIDGKIDLPQKTVAITFDDGYKSFLSQAWPTLKLLNIPATLFIIADLERGGCLGVDSALLTAEQLKKIAETGQISLQFHSQTHQNLANLKDNDLKKEIVDGKVELENKLNLKLKYFAYPGGGYSEAVINWVKDAGFLAAFSIKPGLIRQGDYKFSIKRNVILKEMSFWEFKLRLTRAMNWYRKITLIAKCYLSH